MKKFISIPYLPLLFCCLLVAGCATSNNLAEQGPVLSSIHVPEPVPYRVYTPDGWDGSKPLPLILFLHDRRQHCTYLETTGIITVLRESMKTGKMSECILVVPESSRGYWWDFHDGTCQYASFLTEDFIPHIQSEYHAGIRSDDLHVFGIGTGAMAAAELSVDHPGMFGSIGLLGGFFFDHIGASLYVDRGYFSKMDLILGPSDNREAMLSHSMFHRISSHRSVGKTRFVLSPGSFRGWDVNESNELFRQHLTLHNIPHEYIIHQGTDKAESEQGIIPVFLSLQLGNKVTFGQVNGMPFDVLRYR